jgi:hypothetical protein
MLLTNFSHRYIDNTIIALQYPISDILYQGIVKFEMLSWEGW